MRTCSVRAAVMGIFSSRDRQEQEYNRDPIRWILKWNRLDPKLSESGCVIHRVGGKAVPYTMIPTGWEQSESGNKANTIAPTSPCTL